uniref:Tryptophan synthase alpha chain n=1 Tax=Dasya binghamiae TaxID=1896963 RepID=A0A1C8XSB6_9FLOR|nr:tryptophane synthase alpha subunit [Dasya binghamiae]AOH77390.1 tryptophane synthase alpha subunit [Dasya binghamiae]
MINMNIISQILYNKSKKGKCALIPFITAGYPNLDITIKALYILDNQGADIIELGIPYADALADGPIIQNSSKVALKQGIYIDQILEILKQVNLKLKSPIVIFSYYNPILVRGLDKFVMEIAFSGAKGLIIPDLPLEETDYLISICRYYNLELILFISPTSSYERISFILSKSPGCLYLVSNTGVTGMRNSINNKLNDLSDYIKSKTDKLLMLGFGISNTEQAAEVSQWNIDGIVMGSAFVNILSNQDLNNVDLINNLGYFCKDIKMSISCTNNI